MCSVSGAREDAAQCFVVGDSRDSSQARMDCWILGGVRTVHEERTDGEVPAAAAAVVADMEPGLGCLRKEYLRLSVEDCESVDDMGWQGSSSAVGRLSDGRRMEWEGSAVDTYGLVESKTLASIPENGRK